MTQRDKNRLTKTYNKLANSIWEFDTIFSNQSDILGHCRKEVSAFIKAGYDLLHIIDKPLTD